MQSAGMSSETGGDGSSGVRKPVKCDLLSVRKEGQLAKYGTLELFNKMAGHSILLLDVRPKADFESGRLFQAINMPFPSEASGDADTPTLESLQAGLDRRAKMNFSAALRSRGGPLAKTIVVMSADGDMAAGAPARVVADLLKPRCKRLGFLDGGFAAFSKSFPFATGKLRLPWFPTLVLDQLLLGSESDAKNKAHLDALGVTHVLNVSSDVENVFPDAFEYKQISLADDKKSDLSAHFEAAFAFIDAALAPDGENGGARGGGDAGGDEGGKDDESKQDGKASPQPSRVLVHCYQGVSRSSTVVLAYLMQKFSWTLKDTWDYVKPLRPMINPNPGFWRQLAAFEKKLFGATTVDQCVDLAAEEAELAEKMEQRDNALDNMERTNRPTPTCDICTII